MRDDSAGGLGIKIDFDFIHRVYRTSSILLVLLGALIWEAASWRSAVGFAFGAAVSLGMLAMAEWSVRKWVNPGEQSMKRLAAVSTAKLFGGMFLLILAFLAARQGWMNLLWVLPGFAMPHAVLLLKLLGQKVRAMTAGSGEAARR
jgi:hypothetical protein